MNNKNTSLWGFFFAAFTVSYLSSWKITIFFINLKKNRNRGQIVLSPVISSGKWVLPNTTVY